ncbi:T9SS type A sorting domain-containing protein [Flavobacterium sp. MFBS3-15]|uniref:T9SS type A sorting domain-containing protein n=1 Tax=Flavobacterium sp. MFBS3-15 TaxID=2989816 RepID=UPI0022368801|nr:T9SS type A sorting domain-containing protein [Flavobacterium sp. MFBS3-15]MCW4467913.1 T9SS type A sorting domain-containing protein [Flavobacterium sp. MFBS3-15]
MRNLLLLCALIFTNFFFGQCFEPSQMLNARFSKTKYFDENHVIAFGMGTMIVSDDGGLNWSFVSLPTAENSIETLGHCEVLDENTAIVCGHRGSLYKTSDKGHNWTLLSTGLDQPINFTGLSFVDSQIGYLTGYTDTVGSTDGERYVYKTINGGETWEEINNYFGGGFSFWNNINLKFINESHGFAWSSQNIAKTENGGETWEFFDNPSGENSWDEDHVGTIKSNGSGVLIMSFYDTLGSFFTSSDNGQTWQMIEALTWNQNVYASDPVFDVIGTTLYLVGSIGGGPDMSFIKYDLETQTYTSSLIDHEVRYISDINMFDENSGIVLDRGFAFWFDTPGRKIFRTTDSGATWAEIDSFIMINPDSSNNIKILQNLENRYTLSKQDGTGEFFSNFYLFTSSDDGATWQQRAFEASVGGFLLRADGDYISYLRYSNIADVSDGLSLYESYDFGLTWQVSPFQDPSDWGWGPSYCFQLDENTFKFGLNTEMYFSTDKGQTWTPQIVLPNIAGVEISGTAYKSISELYCWGQNDNWPQDYDYHLYRSLNGGETWEEIVAIPDNNGQDFGAIAQTTVIGDEIAFVSTGGNKYYIVNIDEGNYELLDFNNIINNGISYVPQGHLTFVNDDFWLFEIGGWSGQGYIGVSVDHGSTWTELPCIICGPKLDYNPQTGELLSYSPTEGTERIQTGLPAIPVINIPESMSVEIGTIANYTLISQGMSNPEWLLPTGGTISVAADGQSAAIEWLEEGEHVLMVRNSNECGNSPFVKQYVTVFDPLSVDKNVLNISVYPNPFIEGLSVTVMSPAEDTIVKILTVTGQVVYNVTFSGNSIQLSLGDLNAGAYFLIAENSGRVTTEKIIKQ